MEGTAQAPPVAPGDVLAGKYRVERVLGRGAMGIVVSARHIDLGELFAIKLMLPEAVAHSQAVDRFLREARAAARIKGEHVARVTDVGRLENGSPYMVMEHLSGSDLQQLVRARGPLPADEAVALSLQACDALAEAHALGIVHRDLKPSNLFLTTRANGTPCLKILDFGISKQVTQEAVDLTKTGEVFGTPLYMAPEQMTRTKDVDARSDVWSMGAVLYELLTGKSPFHATTLTEVVARVLQEDAAPPSRTRPTVPAPLDAIVLRCLQKRPGDRYQSITDLAAALRSLSGAMLAVPSSSVSVPPLSPPTHTAATLVTPASPTLPLPTAPSGARSSTPSGTPGTPAITASAWGSTGFPGQVRSGIAVPLLVGGLVTAICAAGAFWLLVRSTPEEDATPPVSASNPLEPAPPVVTTAPVSSAVTVVVPATATATVEPPAASSVAELPSSSTAASPAGSPPARSAIPAKPPKAPPKKKYQDAF